MEPEAIDRLEFTSPLLLEGSWGWRPLADEAKSTMVLYFNRDATGYIEWSCDALDLYEDIGLRFDIDRNGRRTLVDYDGVMTLPDQVMDLLEKNGVDVTEMRKSLAD